MPVRDLKFVSKTMAEFRLWFGAGAALVFLALAFLQSQSGGVGLAGGDPLILVELTIALLCTMDVWWLVVRRRGSPLASGIPILAMGAALLSLWINGEGNLIYVLVCTGLVFIFLPLRLALGVSLGALVLAYGILSIRWAADGWVLIRVVIANGTGLGICLLSRSAFDRLSAGYRQTVQLLEDTIEASEYGIGVLGQNGTIKVYNRRVAELLDAPPEMVAAFRAGHPVTVDDIVALQRSRGEIAVVAESSPDAARAIEYGANVFDPDFPQRFVRKSLQGRWIEVITRPMPSGDLVRSYADVTAYQEALVAAEAAASARTLFLANVSHGFRTPLNAMLGLSHLALESDLSPRQRQWVEQIQTAGHELLTLVEDVIDLTGLESGASQVVRAQVALEDVLSPVQRLVAPFCVARGTPFTISVAPDVPAEVSVDPARLIRVLGVMVRQAARTQASLPLELAVTTADTPSQGASIRFALRAGAFEAMRDASTDVADPLRASAFGAAAGDEATDAQRIAVCKRYVALMGGSCGVDPAEDGATSFWITLPLAATVRPSARVSGPTPVVTIEDRRPAVRPASPDAPRPMDPSASSRLQALIASVGNAAGALVDLPYRGWVLGTLVVGIGMIGMSGLTALFAGWEPSQTTWRRVVLPAAGIGVGLVLVAWWHRRFDRESSRMRVIVAAVMMGIFVFAVGLNGASAAIFLSAAVLYTYVSFPLATARGLCAFLIAAVSLRFALVPTEFLVFTRALTAGLLTVFLADQLLRALQLSGVALDETAVALRSASGALLDDNAALVRRSEAAQSALDRRTELMGVVSHEIRTPMNAILGLTQLALHSDLTGRQREWMDRIRRHGVHLTGLVHNILDATRIEAGKMTLRVGSFDLDDVVRQVGDVLASEAEAKGLRTGIDIAPDVPRWIQGDIVRFTQIFHNLITNAVRATAEGEVRVRVRRASEAGPGLWLRLEVQDTGSGLSAEAQRQIFARRPQLEARADQVRGAGLGLPITKWIVDQMQGEIGVRSELGVGSTFWCVVRVDEGTPASRPAGEERPPVPPREGRHLRRAVRRLRGARVLVVDDNRINREIAVELLRNVGLEAEEVGDGAIAVDRAIAEPFDLVLVDLQMPGLDGLMVTERIRRRKSAEVLPIVAMTASVTSEDRVRCLAVGMNDHMAKPFDPEQLWAMLLRWIPPRVDATPAGAEPSTGPGVTATAVAAFPRVRGLHVEQGLRRVLGNETLYRRLLSEFLLGQSDVIARMQAAVRGGDLVAAGRLGHTLAGVAGGIGAIEVADAAAALEHNVRRGGEPREVQAAVERIRLQITPLLADLDAFLGFVEPLEDRLPVGWSAAEVVTLLDTLEALLAASDPEARDWLVQHGGVLDGFGPEASAAIREAVERYDLATAASRLRAARAA